MNHKGFSLLELMLCMVLTAVISTFAVSSYKSVSIFRFKQLANKIERHVTAAQMSAHLKHMPYVILYAGKNLYVKEGLKTIYRVPIQEPNKLRIKSNSKDNMIFFRRDLSPAFSGTIELTNNDINKKARITVRPVTGRTAIYYENIK